MDEDEDEKGPADFALGEREAKDEKKPKDDRKALLAAMPALRAALKSDDDEELADAFEAAIQACEGY